MVRINIYQEYNLDGVRCTVWKGKILGVYLLAGTFNCPDLCIKHSFLKMNI